MFRSINNDKIGNIINYFATKIDYLSMTKTLKLLYILDETSIKETGSPITWLDYKVWGEGPVAIDIYNEIKRNEVIYYQGKEVSISDFICLNKINNQNREEIYIKPKVEFNNRIFNKYELNLLEMTVFKFGNWNASQLIKYLHEENSLWYKTVKEHNLEEHFKNNSKITNYSIEFTELIENDPILLMANKSSLEALQFKQHLSDYAKE
jgi:uncharacterized phage-associated protein